VRSRQGAVGVALVAAILILHVASAQPAHAATATSIDGDVLVVSGGPAADRITVTVVCFYQPHEVEPCDLPAAEGRQTGLRVTNSGDTVVAGAGCTQISPNVADCSVEHPSGDYAPREVAIDTAAGRDRIVIEHAANGTIDGGDGSDVIRPQGGVGGPLGFDEGRLAVVGGRGNDTLYAGMAPFRPFRLDLVGGEGIDTVSFESSPCAVAADADGVVDDGCQGEHMENLSDVRSDVENLVGTAHDDALAGNASANLIQGKGGHDQIDGRGAGDRLEGGPGDDTLRGSRGDDWLLGGGGFDALDGGDGSDTCLVQQDGGTAEACEA
jgi:Ca2+-binding RTX toxin-like protein